MDLRAYLVPMQPDAPTTAQVAALLGCDRSRVVKMVRRGDLTPKVKLPGRTGAYLFDREDIEVLAERSPA